MSLNASNEVMRRRHQKTQSRLPPNYDPRVLFATPGAGPSNPLEANQLMTAGTGGPAQHREMAPPHVSMAPSRYVPIPSGHFSNPMENLIAASACLAAPPMEGGDPVVVETRRVRGLLQTALAQQETYSYSWDKIHSTPPPWLAPPRQNQSPSYSMHMESEALQAMPNVVISPVAITRCKTEYPGERAGGSISGPSGGPSGSSRVSDNFC